MVTEVVALEQRRGKGENDSHLLQRARGRFCLLLNEDSELLPGATQALRDANIDKNTIVLWTVDNGAWIDAYPDAGYQPFRRMKGTGYEGGWRVPTIVSWR